jgi:O-antigen ligase
MIRLRQMSCDERVRHLDNARQIAAIFTAFTLPLSTSLQAIGVTVLAILSIELLIREPHRLTTVMRDPAAYLPVMLVALLLIGVTWSMLPLGGAIKWVAPYAKLLLIPLLMAAAFTPRQVLRIGFGFLAGCLIVMIVSYVSLLWRSGPWWVFAGPGVPWKDNAIQSECFALCAFGLAYAASRFWVQGDRPRAGAVAMLALLFFANIFLILISRTGALVALSLLGLLLFQLAGWRRALLIGVPLAMIGATALWTLPGVKGRIAEVSVGLSTNDPGSTASRVDFWTKALSFVRAAPLIGHGTGSIRPLYQSREATAPSPYGGATADPHNQFLHVVLQIGLIGGLILLAMWVAHAVLFFDRGVVGLFGLAAVWLNVLGSLFNSHISQVTQGMLYCMAVGLLGALVLARTRPT